MNKLRKIIGVRVDDKIYTLTKRAVNLRGEDISDFVRRAMLKELAELNMLNDDAALSALGIKKRVVEE